MRRRLVGAFLRQNKDNNCRKNIRITFKLYVDIVH